MIIHSHCYIYIYIYTCINVYVYILQYIYIHTLINVYVYMFAHMHIYLHRFENNTCVDFWNHHPPLFPWLLVYFFDGANEDLLKFCKQKRHGLHVKVETRGSKDVDHDGPFCGCWKIVQVAYERLARFYH